ncbi:MAG: 2-C-methyl-D-erythritol 4-phosphate cytidylyltransferase [Actinomycetales bacterium]
MEERAAQTAVIVVAAGSGQRLGKGIPKAGVALAGEPLLVHALRGVLAAGVAAEICVCVPAGDEFLRGLCEALTVETAGQDGPRITVVEGGATRGASVRNALAALGPQITSVLVHDAARPLTPADVFARVAAALAAGAAAVVPAIAVADTIKAAGPAAAGMPAREKVERTLARDTLRAVQTPQGFNLAQLRAAHYDAGAPAADITAGDTTAGDVTDDAMLMERRGVEVYMVPGSELARKITTETDLLLAEALLAGPLAPRWVEG